MQVTALCECHLKQCVSTNTQKVIVGILAVTHAGLH